MRIKRSALVCLAAMAASTGVAHAAHPGAPVEPTQASHVSFVASPVSDARLMRIRGGFDLGNGLLVSFGISRLVYINGRLVAHTRVNIPDMSHITRAQMDALGTALGKVNIIRNGRDNHIVPGAVGQGMGATVIQNSLNNQQIRTLTTIDATVKNLRAFKRVNLGNTLQSAVIHSRSH